MGLGFIRFWNYVPLKVFAKSKIMFFNNANCDVYIGTGAGKKLMEEIESAKRSVKIVSPFLSPFLVKRLIELYSNGIDVQLITTDTIEDFYGDRERNLHKLIRREVHIDGEARRIRNKCKTLAKVLNGLTITLFIGFMTLNYWLKDIRLLWLLVPLLSFYLTARYFEKKSERKMVYSYTYDRLFPFKVVLSKNESGFGNTYLHSKIYIIDDEIAYLGSLNFTGGGTRNNYETRVRLNDASSVQKIVEEFDYLMHDSRMPEAGIQEWGRMLYREPIS